MNAQARQPAADNPFTIVAQYIKDISFENILVSCEKAHEVKGEPEILVNADVNTKEFKQDKHAFEVELKVNVTAAEKDQKIFIAEVTHNAVVKFSETFMKDHADYIDPTMSIEIPFYLFFEIRNLVANMSHMAGFPPVFIRPVDFGKIYQDKMQAASPTKQ